MRRIPARWTGALVALVLAVTTSMINGTVSADARPKRSRTTSTASTATTTTTTACGGTTIPKATGGSWACAFSDEFDGTTFDTSKWVPQLTATSGYHSGPECFVDRPENIGVANGVLSLTVRAEPAPFVCSSPLGSYVTSYTSGMLSTWGKFTQAYGRFEIRAKAPATTVPGLHSAFWLWPQDAARYGAWPASGEIDIAEVYSQYADRAIPYIHYLSATSDPNATNNNCFITPGAFHTYTAEWTPESIRILVDGTTCVNDVWNPAAPQRRPQPFDQPFLILLTQALGINTNAFMPGTTPLPATTQVDYVRVWR